jgi:hypothetical protein
VDDAIEDRVSERRVANDPVPVVDFKLARDDGRADVGAILGDFQEIAALIRIKPLRS